MTSFNKKALEEALKLLITMKKHSTPSSKEFSHIAEKRYYCS